MGYLFTKPLYHTCPYCGASLDPEESCDCKNEKVPPARTRTEGQRKNIFNNINTKGEKSQ